MLDHRVEKMWSFKALELLDGTVAERSKAWLERSHRASLS